MDGHNDAGRNTHHCRDCVSLQYGGGNVAAREFSSLRTHFRPAYCMRLLYATMGHVNNRFERERRWIVVSTDAEFSSVRAEGGENFSDRESHYKMLAGK